MYASVWAYALESVKYHAPDRGSCLDAHGDAYVTIHSVMGVGNYMSHWALTSSVLNSRYWQSTFD